MLRVLATVALALSCADAFSVAPLGTHVSRSGASRAPALRMKAEGYLPISRRAMFNAGAATAAAWVRLMERIHLRGMVFRHCGTESDPLYLLRRLLKKGILLNMRGTAGSSIRSQACSCGW